MNLVDSDWFEIDSTLCPQSYGYNAIRLAVPKEAKKISLVFMGIAGDKRYKPTRVDQANWRYGFLAVDEHGNRQYSKMHRAQNGENKGVSFDVAHNTAYLWLIVAATPKSHINYFKQGKDLKNDLGREEQWPYQIQIRETSLHSDVIGQSE